MSVQVLHYMHEYESAISSSGLSVVDYFAHWCGPCLQIAPKVADLAKTHTNVHFYKVDVDAASDIATRAGISAMPTFHFYKDGKLVDTVVGANLNALKKTIVKWA